MSYCVDFFGVGFVNDCSGVAERVLGFGENAGCVVLEPVNSSAKWWIFRVKSAGSRF